MNFTSGIHCYKSQTPEYNTESHSASPRTPNVTPVAPVAPVAPRKSHDRKRPESHIPRPPNAFMLYRSNFIAKGIIPTDVESKQQNISRVVGKSWKDLTLDEQQVWKDLAKEREEQHAKMYPGYQYKPDKGRPIQRRRKAMTREQEVDHCETLRATYLPDNAGPVIQNPDPNPPRKRKSRAKVRVGRKPSADMAATAPQSRITRPTSSLDGQVFMDPLLPPSLERPSQPPTSQWMKQPSPATWSSYAPLDRNLEPLIFYEHPIIPPPEDDFQEGGYWSPEPASPLGTGPVEMTAGRHMSAVAHIREQFDIARRGGPFPTTSTDALEAQAIFERQPFFASSRPTQREPSLLLTFPGTPEAEDQRSAGSDLSHGFTFQQAHNPPSSSRFASLYSSALAETEPARLDPGSPLPSRSAPQHFPMTLEASAPLEPLHLQPPVFPSHDLPRKNLDSLTFSFDECSLDKLSGNFGPDGEFGLFGEDIELSMGSCSEPASEWSLGEMKDFLQVDVCSSKK